jgi:hypothetical protein
VLAEALVWRNVRRYEQLPDLLLCLHVRNLEFRM